MALEVTSYTPAVGERGLVRGLMFVSSFGDISVNGVGTIWDTSGDLTYWYVCRYHKTSSTVISLDLIQNETVSQNGSMEWGNHDAPYDSTTGWTSFNVFNNSGTLEYTGGPTGSETGFGSSPPNITYSGYNDPGSWNGGYPTVVKLLYVWKGSGVSRKAPRGLGRGIVRGV